jgi:hypothetical protein
MYSKMNTYIRSLFIYFEHVLHPASGWADNGTEKKKRKLKKSQTLAASPESYNVRGALKKQDKLRRNPAP